MSKMSFSVSGIIDQQTEDIALNLIGMQLHDIGCKIEHLDVGDAVEVK